MTKVQPKKYAAQHADLDAKKKASEQPTRDDVHEQREPVQEREGVVRHPGSGEPPSR